MCRFVFILTTNKIKDGDGKGEGAPRSTNGLSVVPIFTQLGSKLYLKKQKGTLRRKYYTTLNGKLDYFL